MKKFTLASILWLISFGFVMAQNEPVKEETEDGITHESPTLQVGLGGISFTKGNLDPKIIAELIARKQKELKTRTIKYVLLDKLNFPCNLYYAYLDNTIDLITREADDETRLKVLLEN